MAYSRPGREHERRQERLRSAVPDHVHGTWNGYTNYGCRCPACKRAASEYQREYRRERKKKNNISQPAGGN